MCIAMGLQCCVNSMCASCLLKRFVNDKIFSTLDAAKVKVLLEEIFYFVKFLLLLNTCLRPIFVFVFILQVSLILQIGKNFRFMHI